MILSGGIQKSERDNSFQKNKCWNYHHDNCKTLGYNPLPCNCAQLHKPMHWISEKVYFPIVRIHDE